MICSKVKKSDFYATTFSLTSALFLLSQYVSSNSVLLYTTYRLQKFHPTREQWGFAVCYCDEKTMQAKLNNHNNKKIWGHRPISSNELLWVKQEWNELSPSWISPRQCAYQLTYVMYCRCSVYINAIYYMESIRLLSALFILPLFPTKSALRPILLLYVSTRRSSRTLV